MSKTDDIAHAVVTTWGYDKWPEGLVERFRTTGCELRGWSDAYGWALLATGRVDAVVDPTTKLWDIAPMQTIIPEAGGRIHSAPSDAEIFFDLAVGTNGSLDGAITRITEIHS